MSAFLDELARTLAKPMPRSKAAKVLGAALVTAAIPGVRVFPASAASHQVPTCAGRCPGQKNCCIECPPIPSGGFPGLLLWCCRNDQECNYEAPSAQYRCGRMGCKSKPKKVCGPDISAQLEDAVARTKSTFARWSSAERAVACVSLAETPIGAVGWEINQLGPGGREQAAKNFQPACATCGGSLSVQVGSGCHYAGSVNYVIYGVMMRLCHDNLAFDRPFFTEQSMTEYITLWKSLRSAPNLAASLAWAKAGYNGWPSGANPRPELPDCDRCSKRVTSRLTVRWLPLDRSI